MSPIQVLIVTGRWWSPITRTVQPRERVLSLSLSLYFFLSLSNSATGRWMILQSSRRHSCCKQTNNKVKKERNWRRKHNKGREEKEVNNNASFGALKESIVECDFTPILSDKKAKIFYGACVSLHQSIDDCVVFPLLFSLPTTFFFFVSNTLCYCNKQRQQQQQKSSPPKKTQTFKTALALHATPT